VKLYSCAANFSSLSRSTAVSPAATCLPAASKHVQITAPHTHLGKLVRELASGRITWLYAVAIADMPEKRFWLSRSIRMQS